MQPLDYTTIPRVVHRIWFGPKPIPDEYQKYWEAWQRQLPDFEFRTWRDDDVLGFQTAPQIARAEGMARKADIARYEILLRHGGIYLDCDIFPYKRFDDTLLDNELVVCNESGDESICSIGFIAAIPGAQALAWAVDALLTRQLNRRPPNEETGPWFFREALRHGPHTKLPTMSFYPYLFNEPFSAVLERDLSATYGIHVWGGSWLDDRQKLAKVMERVQHGDLEEAAHLSAGMQGDGEQIHAYANLARAARMKLMEAAKHAMLGNHLKMENVAPLAFLKAGLFLMTQVTDALVWQIGAADGILVDPLRTLMVNFDPHAVLVEPNPYMHARLRKNYANNQRTRFIQAALGAVPGTLRLNAINPEKVEAKGLPGWALGISSAYTDRNAIGGLTIDADMTRAIGACVEAIDVDLVDVDHLLALHDHVPPAIVVIDVEGMDAQIVELILDRGIRPFILQFEAQCLPQAEMDMVMAMLQDEYVSLRFGEDIVAYRKDFLETYCEHIYVENGIHTIYRDAVAFVMNIA